jgi:low temperature requirement protein LtrA
VSTTELPWILRKPEEPQYPTFVELFFDLVYIFVFTRLSEALLTQLTLRRAVEVAVMLLAMWWVWVLTAWLTDLFDPRLPIIQGLVIAVMVGTLVMGASANRAFDGRGLIFVLAYFGIHLARGAVLIPGTRVNRDVQARSIRVFFWLCVTAVPWTIGVFLHGTGQLVLWAVAVAVDFVSARFGWPTPWLGRTDLGSRIFAGSHLSERHRQIVIVAFGELVLTSGMGLADNRLQPVEFAVFGTTFASAVLLFLLYFQQIRRLVAPGGGRFAEGVGPGTFTSYWHLVMVAGVVAISVNDRSLVAHPYGSTSWALALVSVGGPGLFLIGSCLFDRVVTGRIPWLRLASVALLFAITPAMLSIAPLVVAVVTNALLLLVFLSEITIHRLRPAERDL